MKVKTQFPSSPPRQSVLPLFAFLLKTFRPAPGWGTLDEAEHLPGVRAFTNLSQWPVGPLIFAPFLQSQTAPKAMLFLPRR